MAGWIQRRWYEFKAGDSGYLRYLISFVQFIILVYTLGIERFRWLEAVFSSMWIFAAAFFLAYVPLAVLIGHYYHRRKQLMPETIIAIEQNPVQAYNAVVSMEQSIQMFEKLGIPVSKEYLGVLEYWKKLVRGWKP